MDDKNVRYYPNDPDIVNNEPQEEIIEVEIPLVQQLTTSIEPLDDPDKIVKKSDG